MSALKNNLGLGIATVALVFSTAAAADPFQNGQFVPNFIDSVRAAAPNDPNSGFRTRGFLQELKTVLNSPASSPRILVYPKENSTNMLVLAAAIPPTGLNVPITVCAQQDGEVKRAWTISVNGQIVKREHLQNPPGSTRAACNATILAARDEITRLAQLKGQDAPRGEAAPATK